MMMRKILGAVAKVDPIVVKYCVPNCIYRGRCPEKSTCGFLMSDQADDMMNEYDSLFR